MLTRKQLGLLHVAKKRLGLTDDDWRALLMRVAGVESSRDLDAFGFAPVMDVLRHLGFTSDFAKANLGGRPGWATAGQVAIIKRMWSELHDGAVDDAALDRWIARFGVSSLRFVDQPTASKVIGALKSWKSRVAARAGRAPAAAG